MSKSDISNIATDIMAQRLGGDLPPAEMGRTVALIMAELGLSESDLYKMAKLGLTESDISNIETNMAQRKSTGATTGADKCGNISCDKYGTKICAKCKLLQCEDWNHDDNVDCVCFMLLAIANYHLSSIIV